MRRSKGDSRGSFSVRRSWRLMLVALAVSAAGLLLASAQALALSQRGHVFSSAFGSQGSGEAQFSNPTGVAVDESSGDVYVADQGNGRIERFGPEGKYISSFTATKLKAPTWIAVDNSHLGNPGEDPSAGDVYVVEGEQIDKFSSAGTFIRKLKFEETKEKEFGAIMGIAVDSHGQVWLDGSEGKIATLTDEGKNKRVGEAIESGVEPLRPGFAVDSHDNVFVDYEPAERFEELQGEAPCQKAPCYTAKLAGQEGPGGVPEAGERLVGRVDPENTSAVAVQLSNDNVYVDTLTSVAAVASDGSPIQRFGAGHLTAGTGIGVNGQSGTVYVADAGANVVDIFTLEPPGQPVIGGVSATKLTASSAELHAQVDPTGSSTTVEFQFGTSSCSSGGCTEHVPVPGNVGAGFADEPVSIAATGLQAGTEYHFQVLATNGFGTTTSAEGAFTTSPAVQTFSLPDNRAWEQVSPPAKNGAGIEAQSLTGGVIEASGARHLPGDHLHRDRAGRTSRRRKPEPGILTAVLHPRDQRARPQRMVLARHHDVHRKGPRRVRGRAAGVSVLRPRRPFAEHRQPALGRTAAGTERVRTNRVPAQ